MSGADNVQHGPASPEGLPYSSFVRAGDFVFLAGLSMDITDHGYPAANVADETRFLMKKAQVILEQVGCDFTNLVNVRAIIREEADFAAFNKVYAEFVPLPRPARTIQCGTITSDVRVGLELVAYCPLP